jgi:hypothetical protein
MREKNRLKKKETFIWENVKWRKCVLNDFTLGKCGWKLCEKIDGKSNGKQKWELGRMKHQENRQIGFDVCVCVCGVMCNIDKTMSGHQVHPHPDTSIW